MREEFQKKVKQRCNDIINIIKNESKEYLINDIKNKSLSNIFNVVFKEIHISLIERKNELSISLYRFLIILKSTSDNEIKSSNNYEDIFEMFKDYLISEHIDPKENLFIISLLKDIILVYLKENYLEIFKKFNYNLVYVDADSIESLNENCIIKEYQHLINNSNFEIATDLSEVYFSVGFDSENIYKTYIKILLSGGMFIKSNGLLKILQNSKNKETKLYAIKIINENKDNVYKEKIFEKCKKLIENYKIKEAKILINKEIKRNGSNYVFQSLLSTLAFIDLSINNKNKYPDFLEKTKIFQSYFDNYLDLVESET